MPGCGCPCGGMVSRALVAGGSPCWCGRDQESIPSGVCGVVHAVGSPDRQRPPGGGCGAGAPRSCRRPCVGCGGGRVWWWFENWRVDASDDHGPFGLWLVVRIAIFEHGAFPVVGVSRVFVRLFRVGPVPLWVWG